MTAMRSLPFGLRALMLAQRFEATAAGAGYDATLIRD